MFCVGQTVCIIFIYLEKNETFWVHLIAAYLHKQTRESERNVVIATLRTAAETVIVLFIKSKDTQRFLLDVVRQRSQVTQQSRGRCNLSSNGLLECLWQVLKKNSSF